VHLAIFSENITFIYNGSKE